MDLDECDSYQYHNTHKQDHQGDDGWSSGEGLETYNGKTQKTHEGKVGNRHWAFGEPMDWAHNCAHRSLLLAFKIHDCTME